mgnify:FL=1
MNKEFRSEIEEQFVDLWFDFNSENLDLEDLERAVDGLYSTIANYKGNPVRTDKERNRIWNKIKPVK